MNPRSRLAQQEQWGMNKATNASENGEMVTINGSVNVRDGIKNIRRK